MAVHRRGRGRHDQLWVLSGVYPSAHGMNLRFRRVTRCSSSGFSRRVLHVAMTNGHGSSYTILSSFNIPIMASLVAHITG
jgi:hypothetical protein